MTNPTLIQMARTYGASDWQIFTTLCVPSALPMVFARAADRPGVRWTNLGAPSSSPADQGLGYMITMGRRLALPELVVLGMVSVGLPAPSSATPDRPGERRLLAGIPEVDQRLDMQEGIQGLGKQDRSIADEVSKTVREKRRLRSGGSITNEYFSVRSSPRIAFLFLWHHVAASGVFRGALSHALAGGGALRRLLGDTAGRPDDLGTHLASHAAHFHRLHSGLRRGHPAGAFHGPQPVCRRHRKAGFRHLQTMPPIAWISIAILWFGIGEESKVFIIVIGTFVRAC